MKINNSPVKASYSCLALILLCSHSNFTTAAHKPVLQLPKILDFQCRRRPLSLAALHNGGVQSDRQDGGLCGEQLNDTVGHHNEQVSLEVRKLLNSRLQCKHKSSWTKHMDIK